MSADFWAGYVSGAVGILVGNPLDLAKVRLQAEPIGSPLRRASQLAATTSRSALLAGSPGPLLGYGALNAILFVAYNRSEHILNRLLAPNPPPRATSTGVNLWTTWLAGAVGGLATWVISTPTELVKCRAQLATGSPSSSALSSYSIAHGILRTEGISGLYHGGVITASRDSIGYGFYFWAYEFSKRAITAKNLGSRSRETINTLLCGGIAGVATWASIFPLDVIKTRVQGQVFDGSQKKKGAREIARETYKEGGPRIFVRGLAVCSLRAFVVNAVQWAVYEWAMVHLQKPEQLEVHGV
ncbi:mitochondrial carrier domain-containing protein [Xylariaceae sp. FL0255]|nr:mitochondrial carrier domain-containing protein [Xylariaceae sp. FL0255]